MRQTQLVFSIIIPTYNRPDQLVSCLRWIGRMEYPRDRFEVIVVDDGSPTVLDGTVATFRDAFAVRLIRQGNRGPAAARNTGAKRAAGQYLVFTDDDCLPDEGWLRDLERVFIESPRCLVGGTIVNALPDNPFSRATQAITTAVYAYHDRHPERERFFNTSNLAVPSDCFRELKGFCESFRTAEDYEFCQRWQQSGRPVRHAPRAVVCHANPMTFRSFNRQHFNYGRGLLRVRLLAAQRARRMIRCEPPGFYLHLLTYPLRQWPSWQGSQCAGLVALSQFLTLAGAFREILSPRMLTGLMPSSTNLFWR